MDHLRQHLEAQRIRRVAIAALILSVLFHILLFYAAYEYSKKFGETSPPIEEPLMVNLMDKVPSPSPATPQGHVLTQPTPANERPPEKSEFLAMRDNRAEKETHIAKLPKNEFEGHGGQKGPIQGPGKRPEAPGSGGAKAKREILEKMPEPGEGAPTSPSKKLPSSEDMLKSVGLGPDGGGGGDNKMPFNPDRGEPGNIVDLNTREFKYTSYFAHLKEKIELAWVYPQESQMRGEQGILTLSFTILKDGRLQDVRLIQSSGYYLLDQAAMKAVKDAADFKPMPAQWPEDHLTILARFSYQLVGVKYVF